MSKFDCNDLKNQYGLSCVEDYILYLIGKSYIYWPQIFFESYLSFYKVLDLLCNGQTYSDFKGVNRLQGVGQRLGIIKFDYKNPENFPSDFADKGIFAMQVSEKFVKESFNKVLWRNDHYTLFRYVGEGYFEYLNDIPAIVGRISIKKVREIYSNSIIYIEVNNKVEVNNMVLIEKCLERIVTNKGDIILNPNKILLEKLRDAIGITKVLVKRMEAFIGMFDEVIFATNYYDFLSNYYIQIEYMRVKGFGYELISKIIMEIDERDKVYTSQLLKKLQKHSAISV